MFNKLNLSIRARPNHITNVKANDIANSIADDIANSILKARDIANVTDNTIAYGTVNNKSNVILQCINIMIANGRANPIVQGNDFINVIS